MGIPELIPGDFLEHLGPVGVAIVLGSTRETIYLFESFVATARNTVHYLAKVHDLAHRLTCFTSECVLQASAYPINFLQRVLFKLL